MMADKEYIERAVTLKEMCRKCCSVDCEGECPDYAAIRNIPAADVVEVRHGEWETTETLLGRCCICSVCGSCPTMEYRYCPYCGAKMDGKEAKR
jgi:hypothetical protein